MALRSHPLSEYHAVHDTFLYDVYRLDNLREAGCLLHQGHRHQGDGADRHDVLRIRRSDEPESSPQHGRDVSGGKNANDTLRDSDADDILQEALWHTR